ncbi:glycosyltransferase family 39 protein [Novosphingobium sp. Chol11]|uniref:ArnT family glycosyltransferase n=1 Tax=Novosphingobium sp. Chol11 TaxID=1385763 RepID=UPI0025D7B20B|nr:glycosyltransferase family 39 protein [Novosphingobium sp. Chol11]
MPDRLSRLLVWFGQSRSALLLLFAVFAGLRAAAIALDVTPSSDADWYYARADMLARGLGYLSNQGVPTAYWPPGWPLALNAAFRLLGTSTVTVGLFNLACALIAGWLTLDLGRRIFGSELAGRTALLLLAVYPNSILYVPLALTEVFYTTLLLAGCWLLIARKGVLRLVLAGAVFGFAMLVKTQTLIVVPLIFAIGLWREGNVLRRVPGIIGRAAILFACAALVVAPWTLRNHRELGAWIPVSTNGGITLLTGNNDSARGGFTPDDPLVKALDARTDLDELEYDAEAARLGKQWILDHPGRFAMLMPMKLWRLWGPDGEGVWAYETGSPAYKAAPWAFTALRAANQLWYFALLALFGLGGWLMVRARRAARERIIDWWLVPYGIALYPSAIAMVFSGQSRFHYPVMPFICMMAGWALATALDQAAARSALARA